MIVFKVIRMYGDKTKALNIESDTLNYSQIGSTHHGLQCAVNEAKPEYSQIRKKLKKVVELLNEVLILNGDQHA